MQQSEKLDLLDTVFSPAAPIEKRDLFFGRLEQVAKVKRAIEERGQHAILYGERGVGKTSLANIMSGIFPDVICSKVTCNRTEDFKSIWMSAFSRIKFFTSSQGIGFNAAVNKQMHQLDLFLREIENLDSTHIEQVLENLDTKVILIFDEFDSISAESTKTKMADTIKALSDNVPKVTILIVGIAENVNEIIGDHPSIERCLLLPRLSCKLSLRVLC